MRAILASAVILFSAGAWAQSGQNMAVGPDNGFFRPTPGNDPSLTNPRVPVPDNPQPFLGVQAPMMVQIPAPVPAAEPAAVVQQQVQQADVQTSQAQAEAEVAARRAATVPNTVGAQFTGSTSERDR